MITILQKHKLKFTFFRTPIYLMLALLVLGACNIVSGLGDVNGLDAP